MIATLDAGEVVAGMFIHIPLNGMLDFTVRISSITIEKENLLLIILDCGDEPEGVELIRAFYFESETLWVLDSGEP